MSYQSFGFVLFTAVVLLIYYGIGRKHQSGVLVLANMGFYALIGVQYLPFILTILLSTYLAGRRIGRIYAAADVHLDFCGQAQKKQVRMEAKYCAKRVLGVGMAIPIALLAVCKYTYFVIENLNRVIAGFTIFQIPAFKILIPVGISFYSFMALSYILDVYWKRYKAEENFVTYAAYLMYFPHVVQGPINRFNEFKTHIEENIPFSFHNLTFGAQRMLWGYFKKLVVADRLGMFVNAIFDNHAQHRGFVIIAAVVAYSIQIYADFSGCIDIVNGASEMLGIQMRKNFNHPYFSRTMGEFWRRWHISLQEWFKDYVYYPVSTSAFMLKAKKYFKRRDQRRIAELFSSCFPIFVVWMTTGIWHGADWKYVVWGCFHALLLIGSRLLDPCFLYIKRKIGMHAESRAWRAWQIVRTFSLCCVGRVFFRSDNLYAAWDMLIQMCDPWITFRELRAAFSSFGISWEDTLIAIFSIVVLLIVDVIQEKHHIRECLAQRSTILRWTIIYAAVLVVLLLGIYGPGYDTGSFIYEQF